MMSDEIEETSIEIKEMPVDVDAILNSLRTKFDEDLRGSPESRATSYTIRRVPQEMRVGVDSSRYFVPKIVSIGPVHRGNTELAMGELEKWKYLNIMFSTDGEFMENSIKDFSSSMVTEARKSYQEQLVENLSKETLGQIMVLDGFFIIQTFFDSDFFHPDFERMRQDFLLLENQIPFPVLQCWFDSFCMKFKDYKLAGEDRNAIEYLSWPRAAEYKDYRRGCGEDLKVLARQYLFWPTLEYSSGPIPDRVHHLLHLFHSCLLPPSNSYRNRFLPSSHYFNGLLSPRKPLQSATQLLEAGVKFRKTNNKDYDERSMIDVRFRRGYIEFPLLSLQSSTVSQLHNLLAFEKCNPECGNHVTIYMAFMNSLINTAKDVDLLVSSGVIENKLGSDEYVAHFFNTAVDDKILYRKFEYGHYLLRLLIDLEAYCARPRHRYRAKLERDYLSSPWSIISLIAGTVLLILTVVQTYMAVYSYFIPPKSRG